MRRTTKAALTFGALVSVAVWVGTAAAPALAWYGPPPIQLLCSAAANGGTLEGSLCVLPFGQTTAPNHYSAAIAVSNPGAGDTFAVIAGSLPPGLTMPAQSGPGTIITGNPAKTGTFNFTVKATAGRRTGTRAYQITITVQGPPDKLRCSLAVNGGFLESGTCVLPDAIMGQPYHGRLPTSHHAGGMISVTGGSLPPGLALPAAFGDSGDVVGGTPTNPGIQPGRDFVVQGTGDQGQPLYQACQINVVPDRRLTVVLPGSGSTLLPGTVGQAFAINFFYGGGAGPYTWSLSAGELPPGLSLQTFNDPRDANNELAGTPTVAGTYTFTMKVADYYGQQATQQFHLSIQP